MNKLYEEYRTRMRRIADVGFAAAVLHWDQETHMPPAGATHRAQQLSTLSGIAHELAVDPELGRLLKELVQAGSELGETERKNVKQSLKDYERQNRYTTAFVEELSRTVSQSFQAWQMAKQQDNFEVFAPQLEKLLELKLKETEILGYKDHPYDAMIDLYEPGTTTADITAVFEGVMPELKKLLDAILQQPQVDDSVMSRGYDGDQQWNFSLFLLRQMGYDFQAGRQDRSSHPFTIHFSPQDVRVTTRVNEKDLAEIIWSTIHEGGHALYEQGIPAGEYGLPSGEYISLGIHESQSRLWENNVGRSLPYWEANFGQLKQHFPMQLEGVSPVDFYKAMNKVVPSFIRTSADELTYHFHIYIRFTLEKELLGGQLKIREAPERWNSLYKEYLGIDVPSDSKGILQDVHWSHGSFGYFPTYSLGSFYAAQFFRKAEEDIHGLEEQIRNGELKPLLDWLRGHIHQYGKQFTAEELCRKVTGEKLDPKYFMAYARKKFGYIYGLNG